jgi:DNA-binding NtrC family response regulator
MDIEGFENGDDAFRRYREAGPYDLVITDHGHLGLLGIDFIEAIRKIHGHQAIILQTGNIGEHIEAFERKRKDIPLLSKPYRREQLHEFVKRLVPMR